MSRSQLLALLVHTGSRELRFEVAATAPNPQRDGEIQASWDNPAFLTSDTTPPDKMTWTIVSRTRMGMVFSDVLTMADTSRPRHIDARASTAMATRSSPSGNPDSTAPLGGSGWPTSPVRPR